MTPNDIATDMSTVSHLGSVNGTVTGTQSFVGSTWTIDDAGSWG